MVAARRSRSSRGWHRAGAPQPAGCRRVWTLPSRTRRPRADPPPRGWPRGCASLRLRLLHVADAKIEQDLSDETLFVSREVASRLFFEHADEIDCLARQG